MLNSATKQGLAEYKTTPTVIATLRDAVGVKERDFSLLTGADQRTTRRWIQGLGGPREASREKIDDLRVIVLVLGEELDTIGIVNWLRHRNSCLEFRLPLEVLAEADGFSKVVKAAEAYAAGDYT